MKKWKIALTYGIVCFVMAVAICIQWKTIENTTSTASQTLTSNDLRDQVLKWKEKYDGAVIDLSKSEKELETMRNKATKNDESAILKEAEINQDNTILGLTDVKGKGIVITLSDNNSVKKASLDPFDNIELYLVHAGDLVEVVNALKNAGAEAISINGQRITNFTSIYCAGNVVVINGEKISSPIEIKAIGSPELLYGSLIIPGGYLELMQETGVMVNIRKSDNISIEKYDGVLNTEYIRNK